MDITRGHAMTNPNGLVLDVFQFTDQERFLELNATAHETFLARRSASVISGGDRRHRAAARPGAERRSTAAAPA